MLQELTALTSLSMTGMMLELLEAGGLLLSPQLRHLKLSRFRAVPALWSISTLTNLVELELSEFVVFKSSAHDAEECSLVEIYSLAGKALPPLTKLRYLCFKPCGNRPALPRHVAQQQLEGIAKTICGQGDDAWPRYVQQRLFASHPLIGVPPRVDNLLLWEGVTLLTPDVHYRSEVGAACFVKADGI